MNIKSVDPNKYHIAARGSIWLHQNLAWFATEDDAVLGVVVLDKVDNDFSWVVMTENNQGPGFTAIDMGVSLPTEGAATQALLNAMQHADRSHDQVSHHR